jgi:transposase
VGDRQVQHHTLFYDFSVERRVPERHLLWAIDRFVDLGGVRGHLAAFYSETGRPSIDLELLIRMLIVGYCFGIRSERRLCEEVHLNLGYRWFCRLGLDGEVPDHSTFSKTRHGRFRDADLLQKLFETVVRRCIAEGLVGGEGFAVDASLIVADAYRQRGVNTPDQLDPEANRAVAEYFAALDDAAFGGATPVEPKFISPVDPATRWTAAWGGPGGLRLLHQLSHRWGARGYCRRGGLDSSASSRGDRRQDYDRAHSRPLRPVTGMVDRRYRLRFGRDAELAGE